MPTSRARARGPPAPRTADESRTVSSSSAAAPKRSSKYSTSARPTCSSTRSRRSSARGVQVAQRRAGVFEIGALGRLTIALEPNPANHQTRRRHRRGARFRFTRRLERPVVLTEVVELPRVRERIDRGRAGGRPGPKQQHHEESTGCHRAMVTYGRVCHNYLMFLDLSPASRAVML